MRDWIDSHQQPESQREDAGEGTPPSGREGEELLKRG
jgi:hypothetical protein